MIPEVIENGLNSPRQGFVLMYHNMSEFVEKWSVSTTHEKLFLMSLSIMF